MSDMMTQEEAMNMSNEQAVQILIPMRNMMCDQNGCPISDAVFALDKAIEALSADRPQGEWVLDPDGMDWNIPAWRCSRCGFVANYIGTEANGFGRNPMNWAGSKYCPNCGAKMETAYDEYDK